MRPTITEQLDGLRRILAEVIAPEVAAPYPAEILGGVIGALDALRTNWARIPGYLEWEIRSIRTILAAAKVETPPDDPRELKALEDLQIQLSGLLVAAQPAIVADADGDAYRLMIAFFRERTRRYPFSMTARPPKKEE
ncbi:MAG TPA: hypothetical protein VL899_05850 [Alphaproteobacteria bacterium]|nr:hypothetical protein [Alphaproteobacteria bacterium]